MQNPKGLPNYSTLRSARSRRLIQLMLLLAIVSLFLLACQISSLPIVSGIPGVSQTAQNPLIGKWEPTNDGFPTEELEFFNDGNVLMGGTAGRYTILDDTRIKLEFTANRTITIVYTYLLSSDELKLSDTTNSQLYYTYIRAGSAPKPTVAPKLVPTLLPVQSANLVAYYPLLVDSNEAANRFSPMTLNGTKLQNGGTYCDGIYGKCIMGTPEFAALSSRNYSISIEFKPDTLQEMPIFMIGVSYRYGGVYLLADGNFALYGALGDPCTGKYSPGTWQKATVTYSSPNSTLYLDNKPICSKSVGRVDSLSQVTTSDYSSGKTFKGTVRNLRIYDAAIKPGQD